MNDYAGNDPLAGYAGAPARRRLTRSADDRVIGGVCGGLGQYFGVDPTVFRVGFVALTLMGGSGVLAYLISWLAFPSSGAPLPLSDEQRHARTRWILAAVAALVAAPLVFAALGAVVSVAVGVVKLVFALAVIAAIAWAIGAIVRSRD